MGVKQKMAMKKQLKKASSQTPASDKKKKAVVSDEKTMVVDSNQQSDSADFLSLKGGPARKLPAQIPLESSATVLYIGRIPHGFYENEMEAFFKQFGTIKRLRIARNKKTGKSKHFGFIQFEHPEVAKVVAETMHNYLLCEHILKIHLIAPERVHPRLWKGFNYRFKPVDRVLVERKNHNKERTMDEHTKLVEKIVKRDKKRQRMIKAAGIDYECPEIVGSVVPAPKKIRFT